MRRKVTVCLLAGAIGIGAGLAALAAPKKKNPDEPDRVTVQHILIGFKRTVPGKALDRSRKEAAALAQDLLERARAGEDFDALVEQNTDDSYPGIYVMTNFGVPAKAGERPREGMVPFLGDVAFELQVGEVGLAKYHAANSGYGFHVIKRME